MFSLDSKLELWFLVFIQLFIAIICPLALYIGWGGDTPWVFTVFIFLFPLFTTEHYLCRSKKCKYFIGFFSISFFHFLSGFGLFTDIEYKTIVVILLINSIILSIPWVLYVTIKDTFKLHFALLFLSTTWLALEYLNAQINILTPWYNLGNSLAGSIQLIQWYEFTGVSGGTFWILLTNILLFYSFQMLLKNNLKYFFSGLALLLICFIVPPVISSKIEFFYNGEEREVLVIDTNNHKDTSLMRITFNELLLASKKYISDQTSYIVWPEGALGIEIDEDRIETSSIVRRIKQILVSDKTSFIGGLTLANDERLFNAAIIISLNENYLYIKQKLVPFSEFNPLPIFHQLKILRLEGLKYSTRYNNIKPNQPVSIAICYDALFGELLSENCLKSEGQIIAILSNEEWTQGASRGLLQIASLRAIETRKYIIRSTNSGFTSMIDPYGSIIGLPKSNERIMASKFKVIPNGHVTFYMLHGDIIGQISTILFIILILFFVLRKLSL